MKDGRRLSIVLSVCLICLGISQWFSPFESSSRWRWLQDLANVVFGERGHAKFLIISGFFWLLWNFVVIRNSSKEDGQ